MVPSRLPFPKALLFDMDGTITKPMLDFPAIKAEMAIGSRPILEAMAEMDQATRDEAQRVLDRHEDKAAAESELNEGCSALLEWMRVKRLPVALITRNSSQSVMTVLKRHRLNFDTVIAREDGPFKPDPWSIRASCERLGVNCRDVWMIGDGRYDIEAGNAADVVTVWISHARERDFSSEPTAVARDLQALLILLKQADPSQG